MPRGKGLNDFEKGKIDAYHNAGKSNREIARLISRSSKLINNYTKNPQVYGSIQRSGRPHTLSDREVRLIQRHASNQVTSLAKIKKDMKLTCSRMTLSNVLKRGGTIIHRKMKKGPALTAAHRQKRLNFATQHITQGTDWSKVIWSDENKFCLDGPDGYRSYFHDLRKDPLICSKRGFGGGAVMVWAAFCADGQVALEFITPKINSIQYQGVLGTHLLPFLNTAGRQGYVFQHDNAPIHASRSTSQWLAAGGMRVLDWPACSPDLNPIENIWGVLARKIYENGQHYSTKNDLIQAIKREWAKLDVNMLKKMATSLPSRLLQVVQRNGAQTDY